MVSARSRASTTSESSTIAPHTSPVTPATTRSRATMVSTNGAPAGASPALASTRSPRASSRRVSSAVEIPASGRTATAPGAPGAAARSAARLV